MRAILFVLAMLCSFAVSAACDFPASLSAFTNPTAGPSGTALSTGAGGLSHAQMHGAKFDCIEAMQAKIGIDGSLDTDSFDYRIEALEDLFPSDILPLANGGTGQNLSDPGADRLLFWDDSAGAVTWLTAGSGLTITGTSISATGGGTGTVTSVDVSGASTGLTFSGGPITTTGTITLGGTLAATNGGTGATTASGARTALGLEIGTDIMGFDPLLDQIAAFPGSGSPGPDADQFVIWEYDDSVTNDGFLTYLPMPAGDVVGTSDTQTLTAKTLGTGTAIDLGSDATGDIYYRDSGGDVARLAAGTDGHVLTLASGLPSWAASSGDFFTTVYKASDTARNTTTTLAADPDLTFALATNTRYVIEFYLWFSTFQDPDFKYSVDNTATFSAGRATCRTSTPGVANPLNGGFTDGVIGSTAVAGTFSGNQSGFVECTVAFVTSSTGTFTINWAQNTSNGSDTTMRAGSYIRYRAF